MADKHYTLLCFVENICPEPLREVFINLARKDVGTSYKNIDAYLAHRKGDVTQLKMKERISEDQYDLLYPGHGSTDVNQWDVTLLVTLITEMFAASILPLDKFLMKDEICGIHNELQCLPNTLNMTDKDFDNYWGRLDTATMVIAQKVFSMERIELFRMKIENAKGNYLPNIWDSSYLCNEEITKQMHSKLDEIKNESDTKETTSIRKVTDEKAGFSGDENKRFKTDVTLAKLQARFEETMKELPKCFNAPSKVVDIQTKLKNQHFVVVTGSNISRYFETALAAIRGMGYSYKRSVELVKSSDWRHIIPEDVDLVFCRDPFGSSSYDENKSKSMADIFNSMKHTIQGNDDKTLDIIMVTDPQILEECKQFHDHDILRNVVRVFDDTSETHSVDLKLENVDHLKESCRTKGYHRYHKQFDDTLTASVVKKLSMNMDSVGVLISCGNPKGTVFCAGEKYVLTAYHVIQSIIDRVRFRNKETFVNFNESPFTQADVVFQLEKMVFFDQRLDFAVLEVSNPKGLPLKLKLDKQDHDEQNINRVSVIGFGHPDHQKKTLDPGCALIDKNSWRIICTEIWLRNKNTYHKSVLKYTGHNSDIVDIGLGDLKDSDFIMNSFMEQGVSGAPAIAAFGDGSMKVTGLVTHGIPELYFLIHKFIRSDTSEFPCKHRYAVGTKMKAIYSSIRDRDPQLLNALFR